MNIFTRRSFLETSGGATVAAIGAAGLRSVLRGAPSPNEKPNIALIGCGWRGRFIVRVMIEEAGANCTCLCDLSPPRLEQCWQFFSEVQKTKPRFETDFQRVIEAKDVDAVIVATHDIWHAPITIMACQAGKDVYVEKPHSHHIWESGQMVGAARKYKRVVQVGTQNRSKEYNLAAREIIRSGRLGKIGLVKVYNLKSGDPYKVTEATKPPPAGFDWDKWLGRARVRPYHQQLFSIGWHQYWDFCGGDMCDDGIHQTDLALMLMGDPGLPKSVRSMGGRFVHRGDDAEVPDVQVADWEFDSFVMPFELSAYPKYMVKSSDTLRRKTLVTDWKQNSTRIEIYGSEMMIVGRHGGGFVVEQSSSRVVEKMFGEAGDAGHYKDFIACVKSRRAPNADIAVAHASNVIAHMGNIAHRVGNVALRYDAARGRFDDPKVNAMIRPEYRNGYEMADQV